MSLSTSSTTYQPQVGDRGHDHVVMDKGALLCVCVCTVHMYCTYVRTYVCACVRRCVGVSVSFSVCVGVLIAYHTQREKDRRTSDE